MGAPFRLTDIGRRLGLAGREEEARGAATPATPEIDPAANTEASRLLSPRAAMRADLLSSISAFIIDHDLGLSAVNFEVARDIVSGNDFRLATAVQTWLAEHGKLTDEDVATIVADVRPSIPDAAALIEMLRTLEASALQFDTLASESRGSAQHFSTALSEQVHALSAGNVTSVLTELVGLTHTMVKRSREIEDQMLESQKQTKKLRRSLNAARHAADHDHLTGLPNRRAFDQLLTDEIDEARSRGESLIVAFCDIDNFKGVNDRYGHATGDRVLKFVADLLAKISNRKCHVARHGGEEFALLFRAMTIDAAFDIIDKARDNLSERSLVLKDRNERLERITFSAGISDIFAHGTVRSALEAADQALYKAKQSGRNRVCRG
jgi:diguanylate cyclase